MSGGLRRTAWSSPLGPNTSRPIDAATIVSGGAFRGKMNGAIKEIERNETAGWRDMTEERRPVDVGELVATIESAAQDLATMEKRVADLEDMAQRAETENDRLRWHLETAIPQVEALKDELHAATTATNDVEAQAESHADRADRLGAELLSTHADLHSIADALQRLGPIAKL